MNVISSPTRVLLALSAIKGVGPAALKKVSSIADFWECGLDEWSSAAPQIAKALATEAEEVWQRAQKWADDQVVAAEKHGARIISAVDVDYPALLAATRDDPFLLFVKGKFASEPTQSVAIIGTREPTQHGVMIAQRITPFFVEQRWSVVSGLALGCDSIAHQAALDAGGHTVAVMAHGLQMVAPSRHKKLAQDILDSGGALVSEYPFGRDAMGSQFVKRDRTQAGMAQGVVMIQSGIKGGSLHASRAALDYRRWLAVPFPTDKDRENEEPKVQANLVIADGSDAERAALLRCPVSSLRLVKVVRGRDDYFELIGKGVPVYVVDDVGQAPADLVADGALVQERAQSEAPTSGVVSLDDLKQSTVESTSERPLSPSAEMRDTQDTGLNGVTVPGSPSEFVEPVPAVAADVEVSVTPLEASPLLEPTSDLGAAYYMELSPDDWMGLKATKIPGADPDFQESLAQGDFDLDIVLTFSRLGHLQAAVKELWKARPKRSASWVGTGQLLFLVEDVLTHMKRATDQMLMLKADEGQSRPATAMVRRGAASSQPELPMTAATAGPLDVPLIEVLSHLVETLPRSVSVHGRKMGVTGVEDGRGVEIHMSDLLYSFNALVTRVLPQEPYSLKTSIDAQSKN